MPTMWPVADLGLRSEFHPGQCRRRHHEGEHRSDPLPVGGWLVWAEYGPDWTPTFHRVGDGPCPNLDRLDEVYAYLSDPAGLGR